VLVWRTIANQLTISVHSGELPQLRAPLPALMQVPSRCHLQALIEAAMQPGSGRLRLCGDSPVGGSSGGSAAAEQHLAVPAGPLLHFVYHVPARRQYLAPLPQPPDSAQVGGSHTLLQYPRCR
jgi:hypothetical protein